MPYVLTANNNLLFGEQFRSIFLSFFRPLSISVQREIKPPTLLQKWVQKLPRFRGTPPRAQSTDCTWSWEENKRNTNSKYLCITIKFVFIYMEICSFFVGFFAALLLIPCLSYKLCPTFIKYRMQYTQNCIKYMDYIGKCDGGKRIFLYIFLCVLYKRFYHRIIKYEI